MPVGYCALHGLIVLARAWHGKNDLATASDYLDHAAALMRKTGCRREQDRYDETRRLLAAPRPDYAVA